MQAVCLIHSAVHLHLNVYCTLKSCTLPESLQVDTGCGRDGTGAVLMQRSGALMAEGELMLDQEV